MRFSISDSTFTDWSATTPSPTGSNTGAVIALFMSRFLLSYFFGQVHDIFEQGTNLFRAQPGASGLDVQFDAVSDVHVAPDLHRPLVSWAGAVEATDRR